MICPTKQRSSWSDISKSTPLAPHNQIANNDLLSVGKKPVFKVNADFKKSKWISFNMKELLLEPGRAERNYWSDIWRYRELLYFLAWRDILVRYKQTVVGVAWAVVRPFLTMIIFTVIFSRIAKLHSDTAVPYALLVMAGMLPWQFFSNSLSESSNSLIQNANLISKIYFPRLIVPAGSVITSFVDFAITLGLMGLMMAWYRFVPDWHLLALPFFVILAFASSFGVGLWLATERRVSGFRCTSFLLLFRLVSTFPPSASVAVSSQPSGASFTL